MPSAGLYRGLLAALACVVLGGVLWPLVRPSERYWSEQMLRIPASLADRYTYVPSSLTEQEVELLYPKSLRLQLVQVVHRHGERTPTNPHFKSLEQHRTGWPLCSSHGVQREFFLPDNLSAPTMYQVKRLDAEGRHHDTHQGNCEYGQLTDKGKRSLYRVGVMLRHLYVHHLHFLPDMWHAAVEVLVRATDISRTHHSVLSLLLGLYPLEKRAMGLPVTALHVMPRGKEFLYPNDNCPKIRQLWQRRMDADKGLRPATEKLQASHPEVRPWVERYPEAGASRFWMPTALQAVDDTFTSLLAHGLPLPDGITPTTVDAVKAVAARQLYGPFKDAEELDRLSAGLLLRDIHRRIEDAVAGSLDPRLVLYSAHDSTIAPLLCALRCFDGVWPPFASVVAVELFAKADDLKIHLVRVMYNGNPLPLPFCPKSATPPHLCPLAEFQQFVDTVRLTHAQYMSQCQA